MAANGSWPYSAQRTASALHFDTTAGLVSYRQVVDQKSYDAIVPRNDKYWPTLEAIQRQGNNLCSLSRTKPLTKSRSEIVQN